MKPPKIARPVELVSIGYPDDIRLAAATLTLEIYERVVTASAEFQSSSQDAVSVEAFNRRLADIATNVSEALMRQRSHGRLN